MCHRLREGRTEPRSRGWDGRAVPSWKGGLASRAGGPCAHAIVEGRGGSQPSTGKPTPPPKVHSLRLHLYPVANPTNGQGVHYPMPYERLAPQRRRSSLRLTPYTDDSGDRDDLPCSLALPL
ncbi:hypothetical protein Zm00014a_036753 [Zea mays]|uniref:Uncharacterized protein n=1 Tax=Zea mays TaxID=4577 RepID=A0A3L6DVS0_MAIZE|nr:hypothetical protein Zm00014a_036753 [Zea mays]